MMKTALIAIAAVAAILLTAPSSVNSAHAEIPNWVKDSAGWWSDGAISDSEFLASISFLIESEIITTSFTANDDSTVAVDSDTTTDRVPKWVQDSAGWWSDGAISDSEFLNSLEYLIGAGLLSVTPSDSQMSGAGEQADPELARLEAELAACSEITIPYKRIDCQKPLKHAILVYHYKQDAQQYVLGPITYYWQGLGSEGNSFEITSSGQAILTVRMLAENNDPSKNIPLNCTSPSICNYDVWDGSKSFKYSGMDFTSGQILLKPGDSREFNILFGPNIGYGGTTFEYDPSNEYVFRISEEFGNVSIPLLLE